MVLSENTKREEPQRSRIMELPMELHICIRNKLLADPDSTIKELRLLRLVCKTFNDIWAPVVATNMVLFNTAATDDALAQLRHIVQGKSHTSILAAYTTLTIQNLCCIDTKADQLYSSARRLFELGIIAILKWMARMPVAALIMFIALVAYLILAAFVIPSVIVGLAALPIKVIRYILYRTIPKFRARYYMVLLPRKLNLRNIRRVKLLLGPNQSDWAIYRSTRILLSLPHFTELELGLADATDLGYLVRCLKSLKWLHKLTLLPVEITPSHLRYIATLISNNENLTHFDWRPDTSPDFTALFGNIPTTKPLKLQHLSLSRGSTKFDALIPHIQSLTSVEARHIGTNAWCLSFSQAKIFPQTIKVELIDPVLLTFINNHPGIVSLTIGFGSLRQGTEEWISSSFCKALTLHSETLHHLFFQSKLLAFMLQNAENEANFRKSAVNLRELVLYTEETLIQYHNVSLRIHNERRILSIVADLGRSLTVTIRTRQKEIFFLCVSFCRDSESPLIRDLVGRIVYERI